MAASFRWFFCVSVFIVVAAYINHSTSSNPCALLGISPPYTRAQVRKAFRDVSARVHPDKFHTVADKAKADALFTELAVAKELLMKDDNACTNLDSTRPLAIIWSITRPTHGVMMVVAQLPVARYIVRNAARAVFGKDWDFDLDGAVKSTTTAAERRAAKAARAAVEAASNSSSAQLESFVAFLITFVLGLVLLKLAFDFVKATWATGVALVLYFRRSLWPEDAESAKKRVQAIHQARVIDQIRRKQAEAKKTGAAPPGRLTRDGKMVVDTNSLGFKILNFAQLQLHSLFVVNAVLFSHFQWFTIIAVNRALPLVLPRFGSPLLMSFGAFYLFGKYGQPIRKYIPKVSFETLELCFFVLGFVMDGDISSYVYFIAALAGHEYAGHRWQLGKEIMGFESEVGMDYTSFCATMVAGASVRVVYGAWMERGLISNALMFDWSPGLWTLQRALILLPLLSVGQWAHRAWRGLQPDPNPNSLVWRQENIEVQARQREIAAVAARGGRRGGGGAANTTLTNPKKRKESSKKKSKKGNAGTSPSPSPVPAPTPSPPPPASQAGGDAGEAGAGVGGGATDVSESAAAAEAAALSGSRWYYVGVNGMLCLAGVVTIYVLLFTSSTSSNSSSPVVIGLVAVVLELVLATHDPTQQSKAIEPLGPPTAWQRAKARCQSVLNILSFPFTLIFMFYSMAVKGAAISTITTTLVRSWLVATVAGAAGAAAGTAGGAQAPPPPASM